MAEHPPNRTGEGFKLLRRKEDGEATLIISSWSDEVRTALTTEAVVHIQQAGSWATATPVLPRLLEFAPKIKSFVSARAPLGDVALLSELTQLESLILQHPGDAIDYRRLGTLTTLKLWKGATFGSAADAPALRDLLLWSMGARNVRMLVGMRDLRKLELRQMPGVTSLEGIETLSLEELDLTYVNRLQSLAPIGGLRGLRSLDITGASKAADAGALEQCTALERISFDNGPHLPSLAVLAAMPTLREATFHGTTIGHGDCSVAPLTQLTQLRKLTLSGRPRSLTNLIDIETLGQIESLEVLSLDRVGDLRSVAWVRTLHALRNFSFGGGKILSRDLSPFLDLPRLIWLSLNIRGYSAGETVYSPSYDELAPIIAARRTMALS